jgi:hypothetical protein
VPPLPSEASLSKSSSAISPLITAAEAHERISYDAQSGQFTWIKCGKPEFNGCPAGSVHNEGYIVIKLLGRVYRAHRLAWLMCHGTFPNGEIDHINGIRSDNRISNLRLASASENKYNKSATVESATGIKGVCWSKKYQKWEVRIGFEKQRRFLGHFDSQHDAAQAYAAAAKKYHGDYAKA